MTRDRDYYIDAQYEVVFGFYQSLKKEIQTERLKDFLGKCEKIDCTERTIRRSLNEGKMSPCFLDQIAKHLDVDSRLLSGELHKQAGAYSDKFLRTIYLSGGRSISVFRN